MVQKMTIGEAVEKGIVDNETLGYFLVRDYQFLIRVGVKPELIRFRQHLENEKAHYASDCWDAEIKSSYVRLFLHFATKLFSLIFNTLS